MQQCMQQCMQQLTCIAAQYPSTEYKHSLVRISTTSLLQSCSSGSRTEHRHCTKSGAAMAASMPPPPLVRACMHCRLARTASWASTCPSCAAALCCLRACKCMERDTSGRQKRNLTGFCQPGRSVCTHHGISFQGRSSSRSHNDKKHRKCTGICTSGLCSCNGAQDDVKRSR